MVLPFLYLQHVGGWNERKTLENVSKLLDAKVNNRDEVLSWEQVASYFDAKSVISLPASAIEANDGYIPMTWDGRPSAFRMPDKEVGR